jgi:surface polysaccharide O-acyltransferase-like enzyme
METKLAKKSNNPNSKRIFYLDQMRCLAIIGVICIHASGFFVLSKNYTSLAWIIGDCFSIISRFAVPLFLMISGTLLLNKKYDFSQFIKKRYPRVIIPFLFWGLIYMAYSLIMKDGISIGSLTTLIPGYIKMFLGVRGYLTHYWYVWLILSIYLIIPIINKWIKFSDLREIEYFLIIWIIVSIFETFSIPFYNIDLRYFSGPIGLVILGYYLNNKENKILNNTILWLIIFIVSSAIRIFFAYNLTIDLNKFIVLDFYNILSIIQVASLFLFVKNFNTQSFFEKISSFFEKGIIERLTISLSRYSYGIYLVHMLFIKFLVLLNFSPFHKNPLLWIPLIVILVTISSWGLLAILKRIPLINKVIGVH